MADWAYALASTDPDTPAMPCRSEKAPNPLIHTVFPKNGYWVPVPSIINTLCALRIFAHLIILFLGTASRYVRKVITEQLMEPSSVHGSPSVGN